VAGHLGGLARPTGRLLNSVRNVDSTEKPMKAKQMALLRRVYRRVFIWLGLCALGMSNLFIPASVNAQSLPTARSSNLQVDNLQVASRDGALHLQWQGTGQAAIAGTENNQAQTSYGGYLLPLQTLVVELSTDQGESGAVAAIAVQEISGSPFTGELTPAPEVLPPALDWEPTPTSQPYVEPHLPDSPLFVMAESIQRGRHLAVLGFSPIYQDAESGEIRYADSFDAAVAGASMVANGDDATANPATDTRFNPVAALASASGPTNGLANANALKLYVDKAGMQQVSGAELAAAGFGSLPISQLSLYYKGTEVPLHVIDNGNNVLEAGDYLRFYAPVAGDAWNAESVYWLAQGSQAGLRMSQRNPQPGAAPTRNTAYEVGRFVDNKVYETTLAGDDGDNWFHIDLHSETSNASFNVTLPHQLPLNNSLATLLTLDVTPYSVGAYGNQIIHRLQVSGGGYTYEDDSDDWVVPFSGPSPFANATRTLTLAQAADQWTITLLNESGNRAVLFDAIDYLLPVQLDFGGAGAVFQGVDGSWRYQISNAPIDTAGGLGLYDITNPAEPQQLAVSGGANFDIEDGPSARRYLLAGNGTLFVPRIAVHTPVDLGGPGAAHTIYIAPAEFHATLQPLVDLRQSQGYQVRVVDVQAIYDAWGYGMVDANAIRNFLRFAVGNWSPAPIAAVLVGDTTYDPLNYLGYDNPNLIPPYIANVDPWLKYVPCDSCYGQLDGDDPTNDYLVDIWIGRFPVINTAELTTVVNKIVRYETDTDTYALWRNASLQIADDDVRPDGSVDAAGPFVESAEHAVNLMPKEIVQLRNYYVGTTDFSNVPASLITLLNNVQTWWVTDPTQAMLNSIDLMNSGVGLVTYTGHANHWQWARTARDDEENKWLFGLWEVRRLNNRNTPFISLSMTCYTSQFHKPETNHFTLDEHLLLHGNGGAIATWGPTGFSIVPAHDALVGGFHSQLWQSPRQQAKLGALTAAGYEAVFASGINLDVNKSFAFLGDPLTPARIAANDIIHMPKVRR
jgi:hypothetical protein